MHQAARTPIRSKPTSGSNHLDAVAEEHGRISRAQFLLARLLERAHETRLGIPGAVTSPYVNSDPARRTARIPRRRGHRAADSDASYAGTPRSWWSRPTIREKGIGGHLSTFASSATLYEIGFNHFFKGREADGGGDHVYIQGHAAPGIYAQGVPGGTTRREAPRQLQIRDRRRWASRLTRTPV